MSTRPVGKFGRLPGKVPVGLRDLSYYVAGPLPPAPSLIEIPQIHESWQMLGNDQYGDCGVAGLVHGSMADEAVTHEHVNVPSDQSVVEYYLTYTGGQDSGVVLSDFLSYVRAQPDGLLGHTVDSFAPVDIHNVPLLRSTVALFDFAYVGIQVTDLMQQAFQAGEPWNVDTFQNGQVEGGHCVPIIAYGPQGLICVTWGQCQCITWDGWHYIAQEAWAVITGDLLDAHGDGRGVSLEALRADLSRV